MNLRSAVFLVVFLVAVVAGCATNEPVANLRDRSVPVNLDGSPRSLAQVRSAIVEGCRAKRWRPVVVGDKEIKCSILVRGRHYAEVSIPYSRDAYSIIYSDSRVLEFDEDNQRIHRNYNKWVILLSQTIDRQFAAG